MQLPRLSRDSYRIIDANLNRAKEGLRVCEDILRFHYQDKRLTQKFKHMRHALTTIVRRSKLDQHMIYQQRDSGFDVGKNSRLNAKKTTFKQIFMANSSRVKEAFRVLEEFFKLIDLAASIKIQKLRFRYYALEKNTLIQLPSLLDPR